MALEHLDVEADLTVTVEDDRIDVSASGDRFSVDAPSLRAARSLLDGADALRAVGLDPMAAGLDVDVRVRGARVGTVRADRRPGVLARLFGLAPARVRLRGVLVAAARSVTRPGYRARE